jgi:predicted lipoprotein with Yx(FWY)xxD motif
MFDRCQNVHRSRTALVVGGLAIIASACGSTSSYGTRSPTASLAPSASAVARGGYGAPVATSTSPVDTTAGTASSGGAATLSIGHTSVGDIVVDAQGFTLYVFTKDSKGVSSCTGACATAWPPELVSNTPAATGGVDRSKLTEITRADGAKQLAYDGRPLYRYANDAKPGDVTGQKINDAWFVIDATGHLVGT